MKKWIGLLLLIVFVAIAYDTGGEYAKAADGGQQIKYLYLFMCASFSLYALVMLANIVGYFKDDADQACS